MEHPPSTPENQEPEFEQYVKTVMSEARKRILEQRDPLAQNQNEEESSVEIFLDYHKIQHTETVIRRTEVLLKIFEQAGIPVSNRNVGLARIAAAWHDVVQDAEIGTSKEGLQIRQKLDAFEPGGNEYESAEAAARHMQSYNDEEQEIFSEDDIEHVNNMIQGTRVIRNEDGRFTQDVTSGSSTETIALAMADLGTVLMDAPGAQLIELDSLIREDEIEITRAARDGTIDSLPPDVQSTYHNRLIHRLESQTQFIEDRKQDFIRYTDELKNRSLIVLESGERHPLDIEFETVGISVTNYDASREFMNEVIARREQMPLDDLLNDMQFERNQ